MRALCFWFGAASAMLAALVDPVRGYQIVFLVALSQVVIVAQTRGNIFLLIHYVAILIYFSLAPAAQIVTDTSFWNVGLLDIASHQQALTILLAYLVGVELAALLTLQPLTEPSGPVRAAPLDNAAVGLVTVASLVAFGLLFVKPSFNFVARGVVSDEDFRPIELVFFSTLPKTVVLVGFVVLAINALQTRTWQAIVAALVVAGAAAAAGNPINTARQIMLVGLLPLVIYLLGYRHKLLLAGLVFGAVAGIGPVINFFSRDGLYGVDIAAFPTGPDFDAMFIVAGLLERSPDADWGYGRYLLSALSFMLPRDLKLFPDFDPLLWATVGANFSQSNVSLPPFVTAFLDFGLAGSLLLGLGIGKAFQLLERALFAGSPSTTVILGALVMCSAYIPFLRGPIMGWGPFATSGILAALLIGRLASPAARPALPHVRHST